MGKYNLELGYLGEKIVKKYLENKGYKILEQNCRNKYGEIDLIAQDRDTLVFVEVKTRIGLKFGMPEDALNRDKRRRLARNALVYITHQSYNKSYRIDAVCLVLDEKKQLKRINHYENIIS